MKVDGQSLLSSVYYQNQAGAREDVTDSKLHNIKPLEEISQTQVTHDISNPNTSFRIKDYFEPSSMLKKAKELQEVATDAFGSQEHFDHLANTLHKASIINYNELSAMHYLRNNAQKLSFDEFEKIATNDTHSMQMKGLLNSVVHKLHYIDSINGGIM